VRVAEALQSKKRRVTWLPVPRSGRIDPGDVERAASEAPEGLVVALMAVNHETGVIQPLHEVHEIVRRRGGRLHVDAAQAAGKVPATAWCAFDSACLGAHKLRGPKGIGALVARSTQGIEPVVLGGSQERGFRPGTGDPALAAGFGAAVRRAGEAGVERYAALRRLRDKLESIARDYGDVNGEEAPRAPHVSNVSFRGWRGDELAAALDLAGLAVSSGSACSAGTPEPSAVITAMLGSARAASAVRLSLGDDTSESDVDAAIDLLVRVLGAHGSRGSGSA
jgi:cysteine desulfurase